MPVIVDCWRECFAVHYDLPSSGWWTLQKPFVTTRLPWFDNLMPCGIRLYYISKAKHHS